MLEKQIKVIKDFIEVHGDLYDYSLVKYKSTKEKVNIICKTHGVFLQSPEKHMHRKQGCPECGKLKRQEVYKISQEEILTRFKNSHGDRYNYSLVKYQDLHSKVEIICNVHGSFPQTPNSHQRGNGCPKCATKVRTHTLEIFLKELPQHIKDTYDLSLIESYIDSTTTVKVICKEHGEFESTPSSLKRGHGCRKCARTLVGEQNRLVYSEIVERANTIHNNKFKYSFIPNYKSNKDLWTIECPVHGIFEQAVVSHLRGNGCKQCAVESTCSEKEQQLADFINLLGYKVIRNYRPQWMMGLELDIYLPNENVAIEYNGATYHHSSKKTSIEFYKNSAKPEYYHKDKYELCKQNQVSLIHIFDFEDLSVWKQNINFYLKNKNSYQVVYFHSIRYYFPRKNVKLVVYGETQLVNMNNIKFNGDLLK